MSENSTKFGKLDSKKQRVPLAGIPATGASGNPKTEHITTLSNRYFSSNLILSLRNHFRNFMLCIC